MSCGQRAALLRGGCGRGRYVLGHRTQRQTAVCARWRHGPLLRSTLATHRRSLLLRVRVRARVKVRVRVRVRVKVRVKVRVRVR